MASSSSSSGRGGSKGKEVVVDTPAEEEVAARFGKIQLAPCPSVGGGTSKGKGRVDEAPAEAVVGLADEGTEGEEGDDPSKAVTLVASDGTKFEAPARVARLMGTIRRLLDDNDSDAEGSTIPVAGVTPGVLSAVLDYCYRHAARGRGSAKAALEEWDAEYARSATADTDHLYWLLMAANYLDVQGLLQLLFQATANLLRGKSAEEMRRMFKIENDLEPEDVQRWKDMNPWAFEDDKEK